MANAVMVLLASLAAVDGSEDREGWDLRFETGFQSPVTLARSELEQGLLFRGELRRAFSGDFAVGARLSPLGLAFETDNPSRPGSRNSGILALLAWAYVEWDMPYLGFSAGLGGATVNERPDGQDATGAVLPALGVRVGSVHGLRLRLDAGLQVFDAGVQWGFAQVDFQVPVADGFGLFVRGLASQAGLWEVAVGGRIEVVRTKTSAVAALRFGLGYGRMTWTPPRLPREVAEASQMFGDVVDLTGLSFGVGFDLHMPTGGPP